MTGDERPNFFILLEIDPDQPWDKSAYENQLRRMRFRWYKLSSGVQTSPAAVKARRALTLLKEIKYVMADVVLRENERAAARQYLADEQNRRRIELVQTVDLILEKGFVYDVEYAELRENYGALVDHPDVSRLLDGAQKRSLEAERNGPDRLDASQADAIRGRLDELGEESLYTLLAQVDPAVGPTSGLDLLRRAAKELYARTTATADKTKPGLSARQELSGQAMAIFDSADMRRQYDNTLQLEPLDRLCRQYRKALDPVRGIDSRQADRFIREAARFGIEEELARNSLVAYFSNLKWTIALPPATAIGAFVRCEVCQAFNDPEHEFCRDCGTPFEVTCPSCGRTVPAHDICGFCGFPVSDHDWVEALLDDCEDLLAAGDLKGADEKLNSARRAWSLPAGSAEDALAARIKECSRRIADVRDEQRKSDAQRMRNIRSHMDARQYRAARHLLSATHAGFPDRERLLGEVTSRVDAADRWYRNAEQAATSEEKAELYGKALEECADHAEARRALRGTPPAPPRDLRVTALDGLVRLEWQPSATGGVRYAVVRKSGSRPASATDGERLATVASLAYDDESPETGIPLHYAVFADRDGTASQQAATTTTDPLLLTQEVTITSPSVDDGAVELRWALPPNAEGVQVSRTSSAEAGTWTDIAAVEPTRLLDGGLRNDVTYTYRLRARFRDGSGGILPSAGRTVSLTPGPPPPPVGTVHVTTRPGFGFAYRYVRLGWEPPEQGRIVVLKTWQPPPVRSGDTLFADDLRLRGTVLDADAALGHSLTESGACYFTPVLVRHELGYVGDVRRYAAVEEVGDLTAEARRGAVRLQWSWPEGCTAVLVGYDRSGEPADPTVAAHRFTVEREEYERLGYHDVHIGRGTGEADCFFVVASLLRQDDEEFVSSGVRCRARRAKRRWMG
ncbi:hypothetical protein [Saccharopolyspora taberi]|uniref:Fibronectin type-III domain-containing protein n=1 Tax=Saccharopolyspora taberi TaxID=60895 RepID=A0ABN3VBB8_9PSEU